MKKLLFPLLAMGALVAPLAANADTYSFNAVLKSTNEIPPNNSAASGLASLLYDTHNTLDMSDDTYDFTMSVFGISVAGGPQAQAATAFHIHGAATKNENAPVLVALDQAPFVNLNYGTTLLVGGSQVAVPAMVPATPPGPNNMGHPAMSFLQLLQGGLAYVNVHSLSYPGGEVRGQLMAVSAVPEPSSAAMLLAGLGVGGLLLMRRRNQNDAA